MRVSSCRESFDLCVSSSSVLCLVSCVSVVTASHLSCTGSHLSSVSVATGSHVSYVWCVSGHSESYVLSGEVSRVLSHVSCVSVGTVSHVGPDLIALLILGVINVSIAASVIRPEFNYVEGVSC
jgi:hypothetical protein